MTTVAAVLVCAGLAIGVSALVALHVLPTGLSPVRNPVSQYGISAYGVGYRIQTAGFALAGVGAALGVTSLADPSDSGPRNLVVACCALFALSRLAIGSFPMDQPGGERTVTGRRHGLLALSAFVAIAVAASQLSSMLDGIGAHHAIAEASSAIAALMLVCIVGMGVDRRSSGGHFGLVERAFYLCMAAWFVVVAVLLFTS